MQNACSITHDGCSGKLEERKMVDEARKSSSQTSPQRSMFNEGQEWSASAAFSLGDRSGWDWGNNLLDFA